MKLSLDIPAGPRSLEYARHAEELGYDRVWLFDSPGLFWDPWTTLTQIGLQTKRIKLGVGVLIPGARHIMTTLAAATSVEQLAPGRLAIAVGTGFTGRMVLNQRPHSLAHVEKYVDGLRRLFRGETIEFEGARLRALHPSVGVDLPDNPPPILVAGNGPKGLAAAKAVGDGILSFAGALPEFEWNTFATSGTVLYASETLNSATAIERVLPAIALQYHLIYELGAEAVDTLPGGREWREHIEAIPLERRHLALHEGHCVMVPERERPFLDHSLVAHTFTGTSDELAERADALASAGLSEFAYGPMGPDIHRELDAMAEVFRGVVS